MVILGVSSRNSPLVTLDVERRLLHQQLSSIKNIQPIKDSVTKKEELILQ
jgi:hypothetical protein